MATYNIKLYAHGVPKGQDIWGTPNAEAQYIEAFYGRQASVPSQMFIELMQFDGAINSYYTYFRKGNVQDKDGRAGGYFALTIRINYYYTDIQNIYNLLEAAFNKYIVGTVLEQTQRGFRFLVAQLSQKDDVIKALEKEIIHYLMNFSSDADFVAISGFKSNGQNASQCINLLEANAPIVTNHVKLAGKISISPLYPSSKEQQIINKASQDVQAAKNNAQQQITAIQNKADQKVQSAKAEKESAIKAIREEYKNADRTISQLRSKVDDANKKIASLSSEISKKDCEIQNLKSYETKYKNAQTELEKSEKVIYEIKGILSKIGDISINPEKKSKEHNHGNGTSKSPVTPTAMTVIKNLHPFVDFIVVIILVIIVGITLPRSCATTDKSLEEQLEVANDKILQLEDLLGKQQEEMKISRNEDNYDIGTLRTEYQKALNEIFANAKIDIEGISSTIKMKTSQTYKVSLKNGSANIQGKWVSEDFDVEGQFITPKHNGSCTINYVVGGEVVASRNIPDIQ